MADAITIVFLVIAVAGWTVAIVAALALVPKRRADISLLRLCFDGMRWFKRDTFRPEAQPLWRAFLAGWLVFFAGLVAVALRTLLVA
jgi:hypothetical protein